MIALLISFTVAPSDSFANIGPPSVGGQFATEVLGISDIDIESEALSLDCRELRKSKLILAEIVYRLNNQGPARKVDLLFVSGGSVANLFMELNGIPVQTTTATPSSVPVEWQVPRTTPDFDGAAELPYWPSQARPVAFTIHIAEGASELRIRYTTESTTYRRGWPVAYHQFAYVLAPAKSWRKFNELRVTVKVPGKWSAASSPELHREGDILRGTFHCVPADSLRLTLRPYEGHLYWIAIYLSRVLFIAVIAGGFLLFARRRLWVNGVRADSKSWRSMPTTRHWLWSSGWALLVFATGLISVYVPPLLIEEGIPTQSHYTNMALMFVFGILSIAFVPLAALLSPADEPR